MGKRIYTEEMITFVDREYKKHGLDVVTSKLNERFGLNKEVKHLKAMVKNHGIKCGRKNGELRTGRLRAFTHEQKAWIEQNYLSISIPELTQRFNKIFNTNKKASHLRAFTKNHGIKSGRTGQFAKGNDPWNKGTKGLTTANKTSFKKGQTPVNHRPVGSERINVDGYVEVKVSEPGTWALKHRVVWEKESGESPGENVVFHKDGNKLNNSPENLCLITRSELVRLNQMGVTDGIVYNELPHELKSTVLLLAKVKAATFSAQKG